MIYSTHETGFLYRGSSATYCGGRVDFCTAPGGKQTAHSFNLTNLFPSIASMRGKSVYGRFLFNQPNEVQNCAYTGTLGCSGGVSGTQGSGSVGVIGG